MNIRPTGNRSRQEVCFRLSRQMCPWESQQTWGRIYLLGKKCSLRQMMVPFRVPKASGSQYCSTAWVPKHCLQRGKLNIPETNPVWRPRMKEFFDCFNLFYTNCCSECSLSKSRLPVAVSDWIWRLKCFRSHSNHHSQHHPKTAISSVSAKALVLIFWEQRK